MYGLAVIGFSAGGVAPMRRLLAALGPNCALPLAAVAHLPADAARGLAPVLASAGGMPVEVAQDKQPIVAGRAVLAPANYHLLVENERQFALSVDPPVNFVRPSIDVLFESAAQVFRDRVIAVTLSGASADGAQGMAAVRARGGMTLVLAPGQCEHRGLADAVLHSVEVDHCGTLDELIALLQQVH